MIVIDIPMPDSCEECVCSHWIMSGKDSGRLMCCAMEAKGYKIVLIDNVMERPRNCPIIEKAYLSLDSHEAETYGIINMQKIRCDRCIVHCRECANGEKARFGLVRCGHGYFSQDFYCADGKRK